MRKNLRQPNIIFLPNLQSSSAPSFGERGQQLRQQRRDKIIILGLVASSALACFGFSLISIDQGNICHSAKNPDIKEPACELAGGAAVCAIGVFLPGFGGFVALRNRQRD